MNNEGWQFVVPDHKLLEEYAKRYFSVKNEGMKFYVLQNTAQDQLRPLYLDLMYGDSGASGGINLLDIARFVRVTQ